MTMTTRDRIAKRIYESSGNSMPWVDLNEAYRRHWYEMADAVLDELRQWEATARIPSPEWVSIPADEWDEAEVRSFDELTPVYVKSGTYRLIWEAPNDL